MQNFMKMALIQAEKALKCGEVPVGAVIVKDEKVVSRAYNKRETMQNALYHAEILAIDKACKKLKSFRLDDCEMFVTLEPCVMCCGAIANARIKKVVFGAKDDNLPFSCESILLDKQWEHKVEVVGGENEKECREILLNFFEKVRNKNKMKRVLGKIVEDRTFGFNIDKKAFCENQNVKVVALIEDVKNMEITPVFSESENILKASEIFENLNQIKKDKKRVKIITMWQEKKYFN